VFFFGMRPVIIDPDFGSFGYFHNFAPFRLKGLT
jgi:hypothetical protein